VLVQQASGEFGHGDGRLCLDGLDQESLISHQLAAARRAALPGRREGAGLPLALQQLDGAAVAHPEVAGRRPAGMAGLDKGNDPHPQIERIAVTHASPLAPRRESQVGSDLNPQSPVSCPML
jgi:hypothetical protein